MTGCDTPKNIKLAASLIAEAIVRRREKKLDADRKARQNLYRDFALPGTSDKSSDSPEATGKARQDVTQKENGGTAGADGGGGDTTPPRRRRDAPEWGR